MNQCALALVSAEQRIEIADLLGPYLAGDVSDNYKVVSVEVILPLWVLSDFDDVSFHILCLSPLHSQSSEELSTPFYTLQLL